MKKIYLFILIIVVAFSAGIYFKDGVINIFNGFYNNLKDFQKTEIGTILTETGKEIFAPTPLKVGGKITNIIFDKDEIIYQTNLQRQNNGDLPPLTENKKLNEAALAKAQDMFAKQYFEHVSPSGVGPGELAQNNGYEYILVGENLILGNFSSEEEIVQKWMDSPGHRANILNKRYTEIGVAIIKGVFEGSKVWIGVQEFGLPMSECYKPEEALKGLIELNEKELDNFSNQINQIKSQIQTVNRRTASYRELVDQYNLLVSQYNALSEQTKRSVEEYNLQVSNFNNCIQGK